ncbi:hypothetical protein ACWKWZ_19045 [Metapseudomonas otitidis]
MSVLDEYYHALERLVSGTPIRVSKPYSINNDSVALEAGRGRGCIKKSREQFKPLIEAIELAASNFSSERVGLRHNARDYKSLYEAALEREVSLILENFELRQVLLKAGLAPESIVE